MAGRATVQPALPQYAELVRFDSKILSVDWLEFRTVPE